MQGLGGLEQLISGILPTDMGLKTVCQKGTGPWWVHVCMCLCVYV